jgi:hypothetical protein
MDDSDRALVATILACEPVLTLSVSPAEKADVLLRWASGVICWSNSPFAGSAEVGALGAGAMVERIFAPRAGGVQCGDMCRFYCRLLGLFDVHCVMAQCGFETGLNHVTVFVVDGDAFYLFDPMFSGTYRSADASDYCAFGDVLAGEACEFRCHRVAPTILRRPADVAATRARWAVRNVVANWTAEPNAHGWMIADVTQVDFQHRLVALPEEIAALGIAPEDDLISELIRRRVFNLVGGADDAAACAAMLGRAGVNLDLA